LALVRHTRLRLVLGTQTFGWVHEDENVRIFLDRNLAGIIFVSGIHASMESDPSRYTPLRDQGIPIVLINGYMHRHRRAAAGSVRPSRAFFADLDRQLSSERGSEGRGVSGATFNP
jgi:DNA-binding LacI/PurR family transcriptional regulator